MKTEIPIDTMLKRLHLANARRVWRDLCSRAEKEEWAYEQLLGVLFAEEVAHRQQTRLQKVSRAAGFPFLKTVDDFNFTYQSTVRLPLIGSYLSADFVTEGRSLILTGKPGRGKTHLAVAIAYRAIQNGFDALFVTAAALIEELSVASRHGRLREAVAEYTHPHVLVIDEVGYLAYGDDAANVLYHVVNERHLKRRSMIFTTNKSLDAWGGVLHDDDLAGAIVDRILERGRLLKLDGPSIRTKHLGLDDPTSAEASTQPARISGIRRPEFPEPTSRTSCCACRRTRHRGSTSCCRTTGHRDQQQLRPECYRRNGINPTTAATNAATIPQFQTATQIRRRRSNCRARASACAHGGVMKSHFSESTFIAKRDRTVRQNPKRGGLQKKPAGRPSASHSGRWLAYSNFTSDVNATNEAPRNGRRTTPIKTRLIGCGLRPLSIPRLKRGPRSRQRTRQHVDSRAVTVRWHRDPTIRVV